ncbi:hypothetical protein BV133_3489 [Blastochloris viridis]|uniref:Uncharacterized protein n=1 Tax=Blastochloris viridis TaxID=1079 RepID=A0A182D7J2_BLAVI|nr:hypothetical protein BV133_3489 [Blastochloris viridis]
MQSRAGGRRHDASPGARRSTGIAAAQAFAQRWHRSKLKAWRMADPPRQFHCHRAERPPRPRAPHAGR